MVGGIQLTSLPSAFAVHVAVAAPPTGVYPSEHVIVCDSVSRKVVAGLVKPPLTGVGIGLQYKALNEQ